MLLQVATEFNQYVRSNGKPSTRFSCQWTCVDLVSVNCCPVLSSVHRLDHFCRMGGVDVLIVVQAKWWQAEEVVDVHTRRGAPPDWINSLRGQGYWTSHLSSCFLLTSMAWCWKCSIPGMGRRFDGVGRHRCGGPQAAKLLVSQNRIGKGAQAQILDCLHHSQLIEADTGEELRPWFSQCHQKNLAQKRRRNLANWRSVSLGELGWASSRSVGNAWFL